MQVVEVVQHNQEELVGLVGLEVVAQDLQHLHQHLELPEQPTLGEVGAQVDIPLAEEPEMVVQVVQVLSSSVISCHKYINR